jgi:hypothetical protein
VRFLANTCLQDQMDDTTIYCGPPMRFNEPDKK